MDDLFDWKIALLYLVNMQKLIFGKNFISKRHEKSESLYLSDISKKAFLTLSRRRPLSYRNQSINLQNRSMDWFLYDNGLRHESVK